MSGQSRSRVSYFHDSQSGNFYYGAGHPMKPHRLRLTHELVLAYDMYERMEVYRPHLATAEEMAQFHSPEYVEFLRRVTPSNARRLGEELARFGFGDNHDCPVFDGMYDFCRIYSGGSIDGAVKLNHRLSDVAVNWSGGLHHAKKCEASGTCLVSWYGVCYTMCVCVCCVCVCVCVCV
ncbi:MAG: hypothetical protein MHM6MM_005681, partial [Cercozoa sp. M6MM]